MEMQPLDVQRWLVSLGRNLQLSNPTRVKIRNLMSAVYAHGIRYRLLPLTENTNPMRYVQQSSTSDYEPVILTPEEAFEILLQLREPERTLVLTVAATGLRVSEALALVWDDIDFARHQISVRRAYVYGKFGPTKSRASRKPVPLHPLLAGFLLAWRNQTPYGKPGDFVFPSFRLKGKKPPVANMLVKSHLRPAALKAGISKPVGFHTFRHTLATVLVNMKHDPKLVQELLRQADVRTTLQLYAQAITPAKLAAQGQFLRRMPGKKAHRLVAGKARPTGSRRLHDQGLCRRRPGRPRADRGAARLRSIGSRT